MLKVEFLTCKFLLLCLLCFTSVSSFASSLESEKEGDVTVVISAIKSGEGNLVLRYFNDAVAYYEDETQFFRSDIVSLDSYKSEKQPIVTTVSLPEGKYVIFAFHDRNGDGKIEKNLVGQELDGIGYAGGTSFKQPKFSKSAIEIVEGETKVCNINLHYAERAF